jgi:hypothetical protein
MLKRKVGLKRGKRLNPVSSKHKAELAVYSDKRKTYLLCNPYCEICGVFATDIHHKERRGKNLNNEETWMPLCRFCHQKVESNGKWARENGYLV